MTLSGFDQQPYFLVSVIGFLALLTSLLAPAATGALDIGLPHWAFIGIRRVRRLCPASRSFRFAARLFHTSFLVVLRSLGVIGCIPRVMVLAGTCEKELSQRIAVVSVVLLNKRICSLIVEPMLNAYQHDMAQATLPLAKANAKVKLVRDLGLNLFSALRSWIARQIRF